MKNEFFDKIYEEALNLAVKYSSSRVKTEHLIYALLTDNNPISKHFRNNVKSYDDMLNDLTRYISTLDKDISYTNRPISERVLENILDKFSSKIQDDYGYVKEIALDILSRKGTKLYRVLAPHNVTPEVLNKFNPSNKVVEEKEEKTVRKTRSQQQKVELKNEESSNQEYFIDLVQKAREGRIDDLIGRDDEINQICQILLRKKKNCAALVGPAGSGKTMIIEGLALRIANKTAPAQLLNKKVYELSLTNLVAGTGIRGQFEEKIKTIIDICRKDRNIVLFIDEMHTIVGAGGGHGASDLANLLKPALSRGDIQCIGATTNSEFRVIEKDSALSRRFQKIIVKEPSKNETRDILNGIKYIYELHHRVRYTDDVIEEILNLADKYITNRAFPDKAIDIMDEAGSKTQMTIDLPKDILQLEKELEVIRQEKQNVVIEQRYEVAAELKQEEQKVEQQLKEARLKYDNDRKTNIIPVNPDTIRHVVSSMTGIPLNRVDNNEFKVLEDLETNLNSIIIGQADAVKKISYAIKRSKVGVKRHGKPTVIALIGSTGVGKTLIAKTVAKEVYGSDSSLIRLDMNEYKEKHDASRLLGSPPGYIGYDEGGQLTNSVKNKPYSVILLDEIEKAHPSVFDIFMNIFDEGYATDASGVKVDFKNTIIICTSNIGVKKSIDYKPVGFTTQKDYKENIIKDEINKYFKPEFINRVNEMIFLKDLNDDTIKAIIKKEMIDLIDEIRVNNIEVGYEPEVLDYILSKSDVSKYGAREVKRVIEFEVENKLSDAIIKQGGYDAFFKIYIENGELLVITE